MPSSNIKRSLDELSYTDIYSLILFALYKMSDDPKYSTLSELVYTLDRDSLFNFLECFGGTTIKVPTVKELMTVVNALLLYQEINIENIPFEEAIKNVDMKEFQINDVVETYNEMCSILSNYTFKRN